MNEFKIGHLGQLLGQTIKLREEQIEKEMYNPEHLIGFYSCAASIANFMGDEELLKIIKELVSLVKNDLEIYSQNEILKTARMSYSIAADRMKEKAEHLNSNDMPVDKDVKLAFYLGIMSCVVELLDKANREKEAEEINLSIIEYLASLNSSEVMVQ